MKIHKAAAPKKNNFKLKGAFDRNLLMMAVITNNYAAVKKILLKC
jgi:hypothetical protein